MISWKVDIEMRYIRLVYSIAGVKILLSDYWNLGFFYITNKSMIGYEIIKNTKLTKSA